MLFTLHGQAFKQSDPAPLDLLFAPFFRQSLLSQYLLVLLSLLISLFGQCLLHLLQSCLKGALRLLLRPPDPQDSLIDATLAPLADAAAATFFLSLFA